MPKKEKTLKIKIKEIKPKIKEIQAVEKQEEESELEKEVEERFEEQVQTSSRPVTASLQHGEIVQQRAEELPQERPPAENAEAEERRRVEYANTRGYESARRAYQAEERRIAQESTERELRAQMGAERAQFARQEFSQIQEGIRQMQSTQAMREEDEETKYQIQAPEKASSKKKISYPWEA